MQPPPPPPLVHRGAGPVATVYAMVPPAGGRPTAVKVYPGLLERPTADELRQEQRALAALRSVSSVLLIDGIDDLPDGRSAIRMELCSQSLAELVEARGPLPVTEALAVAETVTRVLVEAHRAGIVHGGVTPSNVLFRSAGQPVLADFGIALRFQFPRQPEAAAAFTAPEVLRGAEPVASADLYGVGALLHVALTGTAPFTVRTGEPAAEMLLRALGEPPPVVSGTDLPPTLPALVASLLAKDPADRPAGVELLDQLAELAAVPLLTESRDADTDLAFDDFSDELPPQRLSTPAQAPPAYVDPTAAPAAGVPQPSEPTSNEPTPDDTAPAGVPQDPRAPEGTSPSPTAAAGTVPPGPATQTAPPSTVPPSGPGLSAPSARSGRHGRDEIRLPRNVLLVAGVAVVVVMVVLGVLGSGAGVPENASSARAKSSAPASPSEDASNTPEPTPSAAGSVRLEIRQVSDNGTSLSLSWRSSKSLTYAVIVAEQGKPSPTVRYRGKAKKTTVSVEPDLKYCVLVQGTDGTSTYESKPRSVRGATCKT